MRNVLCALPCRRDIQADPFFGGSLHSYVISSESVRDPEDRLFITEGHHKTCCFKPFLVAGIFRLIRFLVGPYTRMLFKPLVLS